MFLTRRTSQRFGGFQTLAFIMHLSQLLLLQVVVNLATLACTMLRVQLHTKMKRFFFSQLSMFSFLFYFPGETLKGSNAAASSASLQEFQRSF